MGSDQLRKRRTKVSRLISIADWENQEWKVEHIHDGMPKEAGKDYYGSACVDVGKTLDDPAAYIATIDPFHG